MTSRVDICLPASEQNIWYMQHDSDYLCHRSTQNVHSYGPVQVAPTQTTPKRNFCFTKHQARDIDNLENKLWALCLHFSRWSSALTLFLFSAHLAAWNNLHFSGQWIDRRYETSESATKVSPTKINDYLITYFTRHCPNLQQCLKHCPVARRQPYIIVLNYHITSNWGSCNNAGGKWSQWLQTLTCP